MIERNYKFESVIGGIPLLASQLERVSTVFLWEVDLVFRLVSFIQCSNRKGGFKLIFHDVKKL